MMYIIPQGPIMRYPTQHKQQTRQRIVRAASRRFRSRGTEGATIGTLMRDLRLTHGGFYRHFRSKEELFVAAFERSEEHTSELQSPCNLVCRLLLEKKKKNKQRVTPIMN